MSLTSIKEDIKQSLRNAREAIIGRGGEISPTAGLKDLPEAIYKIPADASLAFQSDDSVAYRKIVPATAEEYAQIAKIGGMTYKCPVTNYLKITGVKSGYAGDGVVVNSDGSITILSEDTESSIKGSVELKFEATAGDYYFFATGDDISYGVTVTIFSEFIDENGNQDGITNTLGSQVKGDIGFDSLIVDFGEGGDYGYGTPLTFKLWLAKTTEGIFEGLRDTKVTELVSEHGNLFNFDNVIDSIKGNSGTLNVPKGGYFYNLYTGKVGSSENVPVEYIPKLMYLSKGTYYLYYDITFEEEVADEYKYLEARQVFPDGTHQWCGADGQKIFSGGTFKMLEDGYCTLRRYYPQKCTISNLMVTRTPRTEYVPYNPSIFEISAELRAFLEQYGYGRGVEGYPNYIDLERGIFRQNTYRKVFDGTENWEISSAVPPGQTDKGLKRMHLNIKDMPAKQIDTRTVAPMICNLYNTDTMENTYYCINNTCSCSNKSLYIYDANYNSADSLSAWKSHLAKLYAAGNPLIADYALAEPIEVDISAYLKDGITFLKVEGGGPITAVNEREQAVPSTINYIAKVGE